MKQSTPAKVMAYFALFGILISIIGTGVLVIYETYINPTQSTETPTLTQEDLQKFLEKNTTQSSGALVEEQSQTGDTLSGSVDASSLLNGSGSGSLEVLSGSENTSSTQQ